MAAGSKSQNRISSKSSDKILEILLHTLNGNLKSPLHNLLSTSSNFTPEQNSQLGQLKDSIDRMELIMSKALDTTAISSIHEVDNINPEIGEGIYVENVLRSLAANTTTAYSDEFFQYCVKELAELYNCRFAFIGLIQENKTDVQTLCVWSDGRYVENFEYELEGTPCKDAIDLSKRLIPTGVATLYPKDQLLLDMNVDSYYGIPLIAKNIGVIGILSVMDTEPMIVNKRTSPVLGVFASRVTLELLRKQVNEKLITLNNELENRVQIRTSELESAIMELKSFNYSVSHDLRSPVRTINSFMDIVLDEYDEEIPEGAKDYLLRVKRAGAKLNDLIDGMLSLSQINHHDMVLKSINIGQLFLDSIEYQEMQFPRHSIKINVDQNMTAWADPNLLKIAIENLTSNAWKYTAKLDLPEITIGSFLSENTTTYFIKDNGDGFNSDTATRLFQPFQRMHTMKEFTGIGVGLATTRRVINRHGGKIWVDATKGKGATFYFTLDSSKPM